MAKKTAKEEVVIITIIQKRKGRVISSEINVAFENKKDISTEEKVGLLEVAKYQILKQDYNGSKEK